MTAQPLPEAALDGAFPLAKYAWLRHQVRTALEARPDAVSITLDTTTMTEPEHLTLRWLLRLREPPGPTVKITLKRLDQALQTRTDAARDTRTLLEALDGRLDNLPEQRRRAAETRAEVWNQAATHPAVSRHQRLADWLTAEMTAGRIPADPAVRARALDAALTVLDHLPQPAPIPLTVLAARTLGPAHALDPGLVASLVLRAVAHLNNQPAPVTAEQERAAWLGVGAVPDELSSRVLIHGIRPEHDSPLATILRINADAATPCVLTLQQIDRHLNTCGEPLAPPGTHVWMCENVAVLAALAARYGPASAPLVCAEGWPSAAAVRLITHLHEHGAMLHYHGDFDRAGLEIASRMIGLGAMPWRMGTSDYTAAIDRLPNLPDLPEGAVPVASCSWDPDLPAAIRMYRKHLEEEHLIASLADDLHPAPHVLQVE